MATSLGVKPKAGKQATSSPDWFTVDREGLSKLLTERGAERLVLELLQNAWDEAAAVVNVHISPGRARGTARVFVEDDSPEGFKNLTHAWTLYAESTKAADPTKRGRFNLGEKLVLAVCTDARITTTKGTVTFDDTGRYLDLGLKRSTGTEFSASMRLNREQIRKAITLCHATFPPEHIQTFINGEPLMPRTPVKTFTATLQSEWTNEMGNLSRGWRKTTVSLYEPAEGEKPMVYEMGIPVTGYQGRWHADVAQTVPLTFERNALTGQFTKQLLTAIVDNANDLFTERDASSSAVTTVLGDVQPAALERVMDLRFGEKRVAYDPTDTEGTKLAVSRGYTVVHGGSLPAEAWRNVKEHGVIKPAGQVTPSPKIDGDPGAPTRVYLPEKDWTPGMQAVASYVKMLAPVLMADKDVQVQFTSAPTEFWAAAYQPLTRQVTFNYGRLGKAWFEPSVGWYAPADQERIDRLVIHEFGHEFAADHLSEEYHDALCKLGARMRNVQFRLTAQGGTDTLK